MENEEIKQEPILDKDMDEIFKGNNDQYQRFLSMLAYMATRLVHTERDEHNVLSTPFGTWTYKKPERISTHDITHS